MDMSLGIVRSKNGRKTMSAASNDLGFTSLKVVTFDGKCKSDWRAWRAKMEAIVQLNGWYKRLKDNYNAVGKISELTTDKSALQLIH